MMVRIYINAFATRLAVKVHKAFAFVYPLAQGPDHQLHQMLPLEELLLTEQDL